jgi:phosphoribosylcarboxyaminoimidazole (NCAIR) mutase
MLSRDERTGLAEIARHLERDDPRLAHALRRHSRAAPATAIAVVLVVAGTAAFLLSMSCASTPLFVLGLAALLTGWARLVVRRR